MKSAELIDDSHCFVCGKDNPAGLKLHWVTDGRRTEATFTLGKAYQGWKDVVHGGILATVLDEAMTRLAWQVLGGGVVTAEITVRYKKPARVGERLTVRAELEDAKGRLVPARADIRDAGGALIAEATGKTLRAKES